MRDQEFICCNIFISVKIELRTTVKFSFSKYRGEEGAEELYGNWVKTKIGYV